ncbi:hypothetical protein [Actinomycetospora aeridis]|uniref:Tetratricopeptide repeat protein n=1 Tax=Actinomycetospora aeridis TaxID=3129231 RepID=A0ABU8N3C6_9PSEU
MGVAVGPPGRVLLARARAHEGAGRYEQAWSDLRRAAAAAREADDPDLEITVLRRLGGDVPIALGVPPTECVTHLRHGLRRAASVGDRAAEADLRARLAVLATHDLRFGEALEQGRRAVAAGRAAGDGHALLAGLDGLRTVYAHTGMVDELAGVVAELATVPDPRSWTVFEGALPAVAAGRFGEARARVAEAIVLAGDGAHAGWFLAHEGWIARQQGDLDEAAEVGRRAVALTTAPIGEHRWWTAAACALLATTLLARGETAEARGVAGHGLAAAGPGAVAGARLRCLAVLAEAGDAVEHPALPADIALLEADRLLAGVTGPPATAWLLGADAYASVARAWRARGRAARARDTLDPLLAAARAHGWRRLAEQAERL